MKTNNLKRTDLSSLIHLRILSQERLFVQKEKERLSTPILTDTSLLYPLYEWFNEILTVEKMEKHTTRREKQFIFIALFLFCPDTLTGGIYKVRNVRQKIANILSLSKSSDVSLVANHVMFWYFSYPKFRKETDHIYERLIQRLRKENII